MNCRRWRGLFDADGLRAVVAQADGAIALAEGDAHAALDPLRHAFEQWQGPRGTL